MAEEHGRPPMSPSTNAWSDASRKNAMHERPLGVTILALLQILSALILVVVLVLVPLLLEGKTVQSLGVPLFSLTISYAAVMIPVSLLLAYGLLKGKEWARFYARFFQLFNIITALLGFNILGIILPVYIILYLSKPHVLKFFDNNSPLDSKFWPLVIIGLVLLLILSTSLAILNNPLVH